MIGIRSFQVPALKLVGPAVPSWEPIKRKAGPGPSMMIVALNPALTETAPSFFRSISRGLVIR